MPGRTLRRSTADAPGRAAWAAAAGDAAPELRRHSVRTGTTGGTRRTNGVAGKYASERSGCDRDRSPSAGSNRNSGELRFTLKFAPAGATNPDPDRPELLTALREQLGLKLEATRAPLEVLVIDSVEKPTAN